ncbi:hypothetical protein B5F17_14055 [Butyricicoccus pullicaecorum]|uniref:Uncharacterized protein n=2 Tax=Butyricicoccus pullicaecorum TaxID=501571 RepID=A0A1Y4L0C0_9FIRM|nr:hypothetical protein B5F17_14055 [Butyricicoccus pullicaecorum]
METSKNKHLFSIEREGKMNELKEQAVQRETRAEPPVLSETEKTIAVIERKLRLMSEEKVKCVLQFVIHIAG